MNTDACPHQRVAIESEGKPLRLGALYLGRCLDCGLSGLGRYGPDFDDEEALHYYLEEPGGFTGKRYA